MGKWKRYKRSRIYPGIGFCHANREKAPVLKTKSSWRTINGIYFSTNKYGTIFYEFRRYDATL